MRKLIIATASLALVALAVIATIQPIAIAAEVALPFVIPDLAFIVTGTVSAVVLMASIITEPPQQTAPPPSALGKLVQSAKTVLPHQRAREATRLGDGRYIMA